MFHWLGVLIGTTLGVIGLAITVGGGLFAFALSRQYVRNRLRFVDAVRNPIAPWIAGFVVAVVLLPVVALLPLVHAGTALLIGAATGLGTASGVKALKRGE